MLNSLYVFLCLIAGIWAVIEFFRKGDEMACLIVVYTWLVLTRLTLIESGEVTWAEFDYGIDFIFNLEYAYIVSNLIMLGTIILVYTYLITNKKVIKVKDNNELFGVFILKNKESIFIGFIVFFLFSLISRGGLSKGYGALLTLANTSFILLLFLYVQKEQTSFVQKALFALFIGIIAYSTYSPALRFQFLGWSIPMMIYLVRNISIGKKIMLYLIGGGVILVFFSIAGALRSPENRGKPLSELYEEGKERLFDTEDINFIDGFIMLYQVYPEYLDYHYGMDHLGILLRPIPRSWWPDKPRGAWQQKYADKYNDGEEFGTGISTTLYGVFYGEGGVAAIVIFAILWGIGLAKLIQYTRRYDTDLQYVLKGIMLASLIPVLRSGDLPGDIAIVGMSYWPFFLFMYRYNKFLRSHYEG